MKKLPTILLSILFLSVVVTGSAVAQESDADTSEIDISIGASTESNNEDNATTTEYVGQIDDSLRIVDYSLQGEQMEVTLESDIPRRITIVDLGAASGGSGVSDFSFKTQQITRGETVVQLDVTKVDGSAGVGITAGKNGVTIVAGDNVSIFKGEANWRGIQSGFVAGVIIITLSTVVAGYLKIKNESEEPERIL
jgi:hypothetical protein